MEKFGTVNDADGTRLQRPSGDHDTAYGLDRYSWQQGENAKFGFQITENSEPALVAKGGGRRFAVIPEGDKRVMCDRPQVDPATASHGEQADNMQAIGYDGYNGTITGEQAATLGANCGMTTGRNGVLVKAYGVVTKGNGECWLMDEKHMALSVGGGQAGQGYPCALVKSFAFDAYNYEVNGEKAKTLTCQRVDVSNIPIVVVPEKAIGFDTYNQVVTGGVARTLTSVKSDCDHVPCVFVLNEQDKKGDSVTEDKTNALLKDPKRQPVICLNDQGGDL